MIDILRGFSKGWVAKILIGLLVLSFGIWGISGSILFGGQYNVVQVGNTTVDASQYRFAYENQLASLSRSAGRRLTRQEVDSFGLRESVLSQVVAGAVLDENARLMGLGISGKNLATEIANDPTFRDLSGQFSRDTLRRTLANAGLSEDDYIQSRKRISMRNQILDGTSDSLDMPDVYTEALKTYQNQERIFHYVEIGDEAVKEIPAPNEADLKKYYEDNKTSYIAPEFRRLTILKLEPEDIMKLEEVTEEDITAAYENRKSILRTPERRQIEQLVLSDRAAAEKAKQQLAQGIAFEDVVTENGKSVADIGLGLLTRAELPDDTIGEAAFSANLNEPTDIVDGLFGPVILRVTRIDEESTTSYEEVKDALREQLAQERAIEDVFANFDSVEDERGAGKQIVPIGEKFGLETRIIASIDANGFDKDGKPVTGIPQIRDLLSEAFEAEPGDDTQAVEIGENGFLWFEVLEITPQRQKPYDEVTTELREDWTTAETGKAIQTVADNLAEKLRTGSDFNTLLAEMLPTDSLGQSVSFTTSPALSRNWQDDTFPPAAIRAGFAEDKDAISTVTLENNRVMVFRVAEIQKGNTNPLPEDLEERINLAASQDILSQVVEHLQTREGVTVNRAAIDLAFAPYGGNQHGY